MGWFSRKIAVTLIDDATGAPFAKTEMEPADLPESFELATTLHLGAADWSVVRAEPRTRPEYNKAGRLELRLRRIELVDLSDILFSLPSICDRLPEVGQAPLAGDERILHEDDWRQFEFVSRQLGSEVDAEIADILRIHEEERVDAGWKKIHVRRRADPPIRALLTMGRLDEALGGLAFRGVGFRGADSPIAAGFSFRTADGLECYGIEDEGRVVVLGVAGAAGERSANSLARIANELELELVDWCRCQRWLPATTAFQRALTGSRG